MQGVGIFTEITVQTYNLGQTPLDQQDFKRQTLFWRASEQKAGQTG